MSIVQHAIWLYHRYPLSHRDIQELLYQRGMQVSHETLPGQSRDAARTVYQKRCIKFGPLFAEDLRQWEPRRGSHWYLDEVCTTVDGSRHWLWRAVDEHGFVLDILLHRHRDAEAAKSFLIRLLGEYDVPEVIHTDQLRSYGAAIREISSLIHVNHQQVISTAHHSSNTVVEQSHRPARRHEQQQQGFKRRRRVQEFLYLHARIENLYHHTRTSVPASTRRNNQKQVFQT